MSRHMPRENPLHQGPGVQSKCSPFDFAVNHCTSDHMCQPLSTQPPRVCGCTSGKIMFRETLSHSHPWRKITNPSSFFTFCSYWCWQRMTEWLPTMGCQLCWPLCTPCRHDHRTLLHAPPCANIRCAKTLIMLVANYSLESWEANTLLNKFPNWNTCFQRACI